MESTSPPKRCLLQAPWMQEPHWYDRPADLKTCEACNWNRGFYEFSNRRMFWESSYPTIKVLEVKRPLPTAHLEVLRCPTNRNKRDNHTNEYLYTDEYLSEGLHNSSEAWHRFLGRRARMYNVKDRDESETWNSLTDEQKYNWKWCYEMEGNSRIFLERLAQKNMAKAKEARDSKIRRTVADEMALKPAMNRDGSIGPNKWVMESISNQCTDWEDIEQQIAEDTEQQVGEESRERLDAFIAQVCCVESYACTSTDDDDDEDDDEQDHIYSHPDPPNPNGKRSLSPPALSTFDFKDFSYPDPSSNNFVSPYVTQNPPSKRGRRSNDFDSDKMSEANITADDLDCGIMDICDGEDEVGAVGFYLGLASSPGQINQSPGLGIAMREWASDGEWDSNKRTDAQNRNEKNYRSSSSSSINTHQQASSIHPAIDPMLEQMSTAILTSQPTSKHTPIATQKPVFTMSNIDSDIVKAFEYAWTQYEDGPHRLTSPANFCSFVLVPSTLPTPTQAQHASVPFLRLTNPTGQVFELEEALPILKPYTDEQLDWIDDKRAVMAYYRRDWFNNTNETFYEYDRRLRAEEWWDSCAREYAEKLREEQHNEEIGLYDSMSESDSDTDSSEDDYIDGQYGIPITHKRTQSDPEAYNAPLCEPELYNEKYQNGKARKEYFIEDLRKARKAVMDDYGMDFKY